MLIAFYGFLVVIFITKNGVRNRDRFLALQRNRVLVVKSGRCFYNRFGSKNGYQDCAELFRKMYARYAVWHVVGAAVFKLGHLGIAFSGGASRLFAQAI